MHLIAIILLYAMSLYSGVTAGLGMMSFMGNTTASFLYRVLASYACLIVCAAYGVIASLALRVVGKHRISQWAVARAFQRTMALATGVRFEVIGGKQHLETRPAVFVGNHQTALDVLLLGAIFPQYCSVTAKKSLKRIPVLGWFMSLSGTVFIDRANKSTARKAFEGAAKEIRGEKQSVFIFPEGTRSNAEEAMLLPFKKGAFHLAIQAGAPIVPVVAGCYWGVLGAREYRFRAGTIPVIGEFSAPVRSDAS
jgi:lysophosphatidate acyltransferase